MLARRSPRLRAARPVARYGRRPHARPCGDGQGRLRHRALRRERAGASWSSRRTRSPSSTSSSRAARASSSSKAEASRRRRPACACCASIASYTEGPGCDAPLDEHALRCLAAHEPFWAAVDAGDALRLERRRRRHPLVAQPASMRATDDLLRSSEDRPPTGGFACGWRRADRSDGMSDRLRLARAAHCGEQDVKRCGFDGPAAAHDRRCRCNKEKPGVRPAFPVPPSPEAVQRTSEISTPSRPCDRLRASPPWASLIAGAPRSASRRSAARPRS